MIGEPHLGSYDRTQWPLIVRESLGSTKGSTPETFSADALDRLKFIEEMFERLDINSHPQPKVDGIVLKFIKKELSETKKNFLYGDFIKFVKIAFKQKR
ncbi:MAG: hypothetical protein Q8765_02405, partial [Sweet potato little leaf phytoplasma]|nr:hypothetical protein [Sweet potato little leaf phytoplasma]